MPKYMQLRLEPASASTLSPGGASAPPVYQRLYINNTMHGQKGLIMRLRVGFLVEGAAARVEEQAEVANFPPGL